MPATKVFPVASVGSNSISPIDKDDRKSVCGVHVGDCAVAFEVLQIPPWTVPTYAMSGLVGCVASAWTAPEISSFGMTFDTWALMTGAGPAAAQPSSLTMNTSPSVSPMKALVALD